MRLFFCVCRCTTWLTTWLSFVIWRWECSLSLHMQAVRPRHNWVTDTNLTAVAAASAFYYFWCSLCTSSEQQLTCEPPPSFTCSWSGGREPQQAKATALINYWESVSIKSEPMECPLTCQRFYAQLRQVGPREHQNRSNKSHKKKKKQSNNNTWIKGIDVFACVL